MRLGAALASSLETVNPGALLLYGGLGSGKTTLVRTLAERLEGGKSAEVSSPSFTICNIYCTAPLVHHFDLYRLDPEVIPEELEESLDRDDVFTIVEWPDGLSHRDRPRDGIACRLTVRDSCEVRAVELAPLGPMGKVFLDSMNLSAEQNS